MSDDVQPEVTSANRKPRRQKHQRETRAAKAAETPAPEAPVLAAEPVAEPVAEPAAQPVVAEAVAAEAPKQSAPKPEGRPQGPRPQGQPKREDRPPRPDNRGGANQGNEKREGVRNATVRGPEVTGPQATGLIATAPQATDVVTTGAPVATGAKAVPVAADRLKWRPRSNWRKLISDSLYLDNQAHAVVARMRDMDSGTKSQLRRLYNAVRRAVRAPESERQHHFVMLRARLAYTIARHSLRSLDALERLLLQVTRRNDARGYERFKDLFEAIVAYNE